MAVKDDIAGAPEKKQNNLGSRSVFALAFAYVGMKLSLLGTFWDAKKLLEGEAMTFGQKVRSVFNGQLFQKIASQFKQGDSWKKVASMFKYTIITTVVGTVAGAVLGWVRGNRVEHAKDIALHPIRSLKIVFGFGPKTEKTEAAKTTPSQELSAPESEESLRWRKQVEPSPTVPGISH